MSTRRLRTQRGVVFPSPVVILSVIAVAMAGVAFLFTDGSSSDEHQISSASSQQSVSPSPTRTSGSPSASSTGSASAPGQPSPTKSGSASGSAKPTPAVDRATTPVVVFNNSRVTGLAAQVAAKAGQIGWQVVGADNWYGTVSTSTVYFPSGMKPAAKKLALDLGITRTAPAVDPMRDDRLTVILTGPLA